MALVVFFCTSWKLFKCLSSLFLPAVFVGFFFYVVGVKVAAEHCTLKSFLSSDSGG